MISKEIYRELFKLFILLFTAFTSTYGTIKLGDLLLDRIFEPLLMPIFIKIGKCLSWLIDLIFFSSKKSKAKMAEFERNRLAYSNRLIFEKGGAYNDFGIKTKEEYCLFPHIHENDDEFSCFAETVVDELFMDYKTVSHDCSYTIENITRSEIILYGYSEYPFSELIFTEIHNSINMEEYDIAVSSIFHPGCLSIYIDPKKIDVWDVATKIKSTCEAHGKTLKINL